MLTGNALLAMICVFKFHHIYGYCMLCINSIIDKQVYTKEFTKVNEYERKSGF